MAGSDFLQLDPGGVPRGTRTDWLAARIREAIMREALPLGARLPSTRVLAEELGFARGTVAEAYRRLSEEGLVAGRAGAGSVVAARPNEAAPSGARGPVPVPADFAAPADPAVTDLSSGLPDLSAFPRAAWLRAERDVLAAASARQLGYAPAEGAAELRAELSSWLARSRGVVAPAERVIVTGGVAGAVSLLAQVLRADGHDAVAVEDPGAEGNSLLLGYWMPRVPAVSVDEGGIDVAALGASAARAVVVTPAHQYPTGVILSPARRRELIDWARRRDALVIEDDYDAEYRYGRGPVRAVQPLDPDVVAYTASLSKTLAPALRLGWLVPPARMHARLAELRWATDLGSPVIPQLTLARLLRSGALERHLRTMRTRHRVRRDAAAVAIREHLPGCTVRGIAAGLHLLVQLPEGSDDARIAEDARELGVLVRPLSRHYANSGPPGLVINYAGHHPARLEAAIRVLGTVAG